MKPTDHEEVVGPADHPDDVLDRFFERQRRESLARIARFEARRRARRVALPMVALLLVVVAVVGIKAIQTPAPVSSDADIDWLFAWDLPGDSVSDPLAAYGRWAPIADDAAENGDYDDLLLPPLPSFLTTDDLAADYDSTDQT